MIPVHPLAASGFAPWPLLAIAAVVVALLALRLLVVALLPVQLSAQPTPQETVTIQVTDTAGAVIPGARIEVDPSPSKPEPILKTDGNGQAVLSLPAGAHTLSIAAPGFDEQMLKIDVKAERVNPIVTALRVAYYYGPTLVSPGWDIMTKTPDPVFLLLQPMLNFGPLPSRRLKKHW